MAAETQYRISREPVDYTNSNFLVIIFSVIILVAFLFLPWIRFDADFKFNGARLMTDSLTGGTFEAFVTQKIVLIPIAALVAAGIGLWGLMNAHRSRMAAFIASAIGLIGMYYFYELRYVLEGEVADAVRNGMGDGLKVAFLGMLGLILQIFISIKVPRKWIPYLFLIGPLILYMIWVIGPTIYTFYLSLTDWDGVSSANYIGFENFERLVDDRRFGEALANNIKWLVLFLTVPTTIGLGLALIFNTEMRGGRWFKVSFYSPLVLSGPVIALVWTWVYHPRSGLINSLLSSSGLVEDTPGWLADRSIAIYCIIAAAIWRQVGYVMILYLAGLKNLDPTLIDAGLVDGANRWQLFRHVIFPLLAPVTTIVFVVSVIDSLRAFDLVQIMTRGGQNTEVLANFMYIEAFNNYKMGYAGAIAVVLFTISVFFVGIYLWITLKDELEY